ncbi:hypothetical protein H6F74_19175 [Trichocoleus sp. FACHB-90]|uniref:hypothetical protein n=1 Tax=Cyanophyceae TaxID=3028117 RepID=UPI001688F61A|nr:hypothetical protein [Trichocoleus sp. FACHB-90]MBD1928352.1 hypothetical protein [Trichocoleus sp. FACHB-90]
MPDGDIVHSRLTRLYQKPYQSLCEGKADSHECAGYVIEALKRDIMRKGDLPAKLAKRMGESLEQALNDAGESGTVNWAALSVEFDRLAQRTNGSHYLKELTLHAGKSVFRDLRYGREIEADNASEAIFKRYMYQVYKSGFKERIPLTSEHYAGIDEVTLAGRIEEIQSDIKAAISTWAKKANADESVANLKQPPRRKVNKAEDREEDLLSAHNHNNCRKIDKLLQGEESVELSQITTHNLKEYLSSPL